MPLAGFFLARGNQGLAAWGYRLGYWAAGVSGTAGPTVLRRREGVPSTFELPDAGLAQLQITPGRAWRELGGFHQVVEEEGGVVGGFVGGGLVELAFQEFQGSDVVRAIGGDDGGGLFIAGVEDAPFPFQRAGGGVSPEAAELESEVGTLRARRLVGGDDTIDGIENGLVNLGGGAALG